MVLVKIVPQELVIVEACTPIVLIEKYPGTYEGEYEITPRAYDQTLDTKDKTLLQDMTVFKIPFSETINLSGGYTANIGG